MSNAVMVRIELEGGKVVIIQGNIVGRALGPATVQGQSPVQERRSQPPQGSLTDRAQARDAQARVQRKQEARQEAAQVYPEHGVAKASRYNGFYCPTRQEDGSWCPWRWPARKREAA
jgi:hypothetical protein